MKKEVKFIVTVEQLWLLNKALEQFARDEFKIFLSEYDVDVDRFSKDMDDLVDRMENVIPKG